MATPLVPTLASVIRRAIEEARADHHGAIPGRVERVRDAAKGVVDVKPLVKDHVEIQGETVIISVPIVTNVPVMLPCTASRGIWFDIQLGDTVLLLASDRSIDLWLAQGGEVDPKDPRRHALSDGIAIPGLLPFNAARTAVWQPAALGTALRTELDALWDAFLGHQHDIVGVTAGGQTVAATPAGATGAVPSVATKDATAPPRTAAKETTSSATVKVSE